MVIALHAPSRETGLLNTATGENAKSCAHDQAHDFLRSGFNLETRELARVSRVFPDKADNSLRMLRQSPRHQDDVADAGGIRRTRARTDIGTHEAALAAAKARGIKLGNPRYAESLARARAARGYKDAPPEVQNLISAWRNSEETLQSIATG